MSFIRLHPTLHTRPLAQFLLRPLQTRRDDLVRQIVGYAEHEDVADVLDIRVVANPVAPENVEEEFEPWE
jgi:hypothetical protein